MAAAAELKGHLIGNCQKYSLWLWKIFPLLLCMDLSSISVLQQGKQAKYEKPQIIWNSCTQRRQQVLISTVGLKAIEVSCISIFIQYIHYTIKKYEILSLKIILLIDLKDWIAVCCCMYTIRFSVYFPVINATKHLPSAYLLYLHRGKASWNITYSAGSITQNVFLISKSRN